MKYIFSILLCLVLQTGFSQIIKTVGYSYTNGTPTYTPAKAGSWLALDTVTWRYYTWNGSTWVSDGFRIQTISGCSAPAYTPTKFQSLFVINACTVMQGGPELYYWNGSAWLQINEGQTYTAGTGISIDGDNEITNTAPSLWTLSGGDIYRLTGNVGVGASAPVEKLDIDGHLRYEQLLAPAAPTATVNASAGNLNGDYWYKITFVTALGETEPGLESSVVNVSNQQVNLTNIATGPSNVIARKIYRSTSGFGSPYPHSSYYVALITTLNDNTTTTYTDNTADGSVGALANMVNTTGGIVYNKDVRVVVTDPTLTAVGYNSGRLNKGIENAFFGGDAGYSNTDGYWNLFSGVRAGKSNTIGFENTYTGAMSGFSNPNGYYNTYTGCVAGYWSNGAFNNTFNGYASGNRTTTGRDNTYDGVFSGYLNIDGVANVAIGSRAGSFLADGTSHLSSAINSVYIGASSKGFTANDVNAIVIGANAIGIGSNSVVLGDTNIVVTALRGDVGIGTTTPENKLDVRKAGLSAHIGISPLSGGSTPTPSIAGIKMYSLDNAYLVSSIEGIGRSATTLSGAMTLNVASDVTTGVLSEKMRIEGDGKVGIGTTTPSALLHVSGGDFWNTSGGSTIKFVGGGDIRSNSTIYFSTETTGDIYFRPGYNNLLFLANAGNVGIGTVSPSASAKVDIVSTTQGFLPPRMTTAQRNAISSPATGLSLYCTDCTATDASTGVMQTYNGTTWKNNW